MAILLLIYHINIYKQSLAQPRAQTKRYASIPSVLGGTTEFLGLDEAVLAAAQAAKSASMDRGYPPREQADPEDVQHRNGWWKNMTEID